jgi:hypothetical protein
LRAITLDRTPMPTKQRLRPLKNLFDLIRNPADELEKVLARASRTTPVLFPVP